MLSLRHGRHSNEAAGRTSTSRNVELLPSAVNDSHIDARISITFTSGFQDDSPKILVPQSHFTDVARGPTSASVIASPKSDVRATPYIRLSPYALTD